MTVENSSDESINIAKVVNSFSILDWIVGRVFSLVDSLLNLVLLFPSQKPIFQVLNGVKMPQNLLLVPC